MFTLPVERDDGLGFNPLEWTIDKTLALSKRIQSDAERERVRISQNNARLMSLEARASGIRDATKRARVLAAIQGAVRRQGEIATRWRTYAARFSEFAKRFDAFMAEHGFSARAGVGALPLVPVVVVGIAVLVLSPLIQSIASMNSAQGRAVGEIAKLTDAYVKGELAPDQYAAAVAAIERTAKAANSGPDPLGLANLAESLVPLALIVGAFLIVPPLLKRARA